MATLRKKTTKKSKPKPRVDWLNRIIGKRETRKAPPGRMTTRRSKTAGASKRAQNRKKKG